MADKKKKNKIMYDGRIWPETISFKKISWTRGRLVLLMSIVKNGRWFAKQSETFLSNNAWHEVVWFCYWETPLLRLSRSSAIPPREPIQRLCSDQGDSDFLQTDTLRYIYLVSNYRKPRNLNCLDKSYQSPHGEKGWEEHGIREVILEKLEAQLFNCLLSSRSGLMLMIGWGWKGNWKYCWGC